MKTSSHLSLTFLCLSLSALQPNLTYSQPLQGFGYTLNETLRSATVHRAKPSNPGKKRSMLDSATFVDVAGNIGVAVSGGLGYGGLAFADFNNDNLLDIFISVADNPFTSTVETNKLLMNTPAFVYDDVSVERGISNYVGNDKGGVLLVDFDNDGDLDLFVVDFFERNYYYKNVNGSYIDFTQQAGLEGQHPFPSSSGACAGDFNNDGYVDIFVGNANGNNYLYQNTGNNHFIDVASSANVAGNGHWTTDAVFFDYDNDNDADLLASNWPSSPILYRNNNNGTFTNVTQSANLLIGNDVSHLAVGDYNNDGWLDIYFGKIQTSDPNLLFRNNGNNTFTDVTTFAQVGDSGDCRSVNFVDYDSDGDLDLFVSNSSNQPRGNRLYKNNNDGTFTDVAELAGVASTTNNGQAIWGDYDNDGDLDVFIDQSDSCLLYQNQGNPHQWFELKLIGRESNRDAIGAKVYLYAEDHFAYQYAFGGFGVTQHSSLLFFGLNDHTMIDSLKIHWPSGIVDSFTNVSVNQVFTVYEDSTVTAVGGTTHDLPGDIVLKQNYPNPFNPSTTITYSLPHSSDVTLSIFNTLGQKIAVLVNEYRGIGTHQEVWNASGVASGVYYCRLKAGDFVQTKKLVVLR